MGTIYKLIIEDDEGKTTVYPLSQGEVSIGRKDGNTIRLMERNVSRRHAKLLRSNGTVYVEDLDSYNGVRINGERINGRYEVKEGDLVEIGDYHLALQAAEVQDEPRVPSQPPRAEPAGARDASLLAGTVPDFRLPEDILAGLRPLHVTPGAQKASPRDTLVDHPTPLAAPAPTVGAPTKAAAAPGFGEQGAARAEDPGRRELPSFPMPSSGGAAGFAARAGSVTELDARQPPAKASGGAAATAGAATGLPVKREAEPLAPTVPISVGPARVAAVPRLICVSTSYAGKEFALTRPELIIGRVEDNDIVIEHRSVSRNHAKVVFDGRAHKIIDLQSANGILVNGEEYAMTDLRKGDLVELGHVRFRFVPSGEAFSPTEDELREMKEAGITPPLAADAAPAAARPLAETATQPHFGPPPGAPAAQAAPKLSAPARPHDAPEVPSYDPSMAATVTDTPLSALAFGAMAMPEVEPPARPVSARTEPAIDRRDIERADRRDTVAPRATPSDQRPTEHAVSAQKAGPRAAVRAADGATGAEAVRASAAEAGADGGSAARSKTGLVIGLAVGVLALVAVAVALLAGSSGQDAVADKALDELIQAKNFRAATEYCKANQGAFKDQARAMKLCFDAAAQLAAQPKPEEPKKEPAPSGSAVDPRPEGDHPEPAPPDGDGRGAAQAADAKAAAAQAAVEPPAGEPDEPGDDAAAGAKKAATKRATPSKAAAVDKGAGAKATLSPAEKANKARELHDRAWRSWNAGDASKAIDYFGQCIALANLPKCHRTLGTVYAQLGDTAKALQHYKQYVQLDPTASDVPRVRDIIREAESQP